MSALQDSIREAAWCQCTQFTAEYEDALRLAEATEVEVERLREEILCLVDFAQYAMATFHLLDHHEGYERAAGVLKEDEHGEKGA